MSAHNPLHVSFTLPNEFLARWLDYAIAKSGLSPDEWFADFIARHQHEDMCASISELNHRIDAAETTPRTPNPNYDPNAPVPPRPDNARATSPSSHWRTS